MGSFQGAIPFEVWISPWDLFLGARLDALHDEIQLKIGIILDTRDGSDYFLLHMYAMISLVTGL